MKYNVGDKVQVRKDLEPNKCYGYWLTSGMRDLIGAVVTITSVNTVHNCYTVCEMEGKAGREQWWTDEMFEGLAEEEPPATAPHTDWSWEDLF